MNATKGLIAVFAVMAMAAMMGGAAAQQQGQPESGSMMDQPSQGGPGMDHGMMGGGGPTMGQQPQGGPGMDHGTMGGGGMMGGVGSMMGHGMMRGMGSKRGDGAMCGMMTSHIEGRLAFLKAEIKITPEQESLWNDYAAAIRDNAQAISAGCASMMGQDGAKAPGLPDRLEAQEKFLTARIDALRATIKTLKPLYDALSDTQKQTADQLIRGSTGMM
jgi:hypothetical protein